MKKAPEVLPQDEFNRALVNDARVALVERHFMGGDCLNVDVFPGGARFTGGDRIAVGDRELRLR